MAKKGMIIQVWLGQGVLKGYFGKQEDGDDDYKITLTIIIVIVIIIIIITTII